MLGLEMVLILRGITLVDIADEMGIKKQSVFTWIKTKNIPKGRVKWLTDRLGVPAEILTAELDTEKMEWELFRYVK